ncbi:MAG: glutathione S-transferase family protein [Parafilimonas terrae]|nr:glutathione S-transferase family protein [Parafilimonas terrae]
MRILTNTTSPYARIARIALGEKGFDLSPTEIVNPWADPASLIGLNPASRVPTLEADSGLPLTESLLILLWLEKKQPQPSLLDGDLDRLVSQAGRAMGVIDAMANIITGVMQMDPNWGETRVGLKRRRTVVTGLRPLEADPPAYGGGTPDIAVITAVVAVDYLKLRFADAPWVEPIPRLQALRDEVAERPAFKSTEPYIP